MQPTRTALVLVSVLLGACAHADRRTLAELHRVVPDMIEVTLARHPVGRDGRDLAVDLLAQRVL